MDSETLSHKEGCEHEGSSADIWGKCEKDTADNKRV